MPLWKRRVASSPPPRNVRGSYGGGSTRASWINEGSCATGGADPPGGATLPGGRGPDGRWVPPLPIRSDATGEPFHTTTSTASTTTAARAAADAQASHR